MLKFRQFYTLASLTAVESIRQPISLLLTASCVLLTALTPVLMMHHFGEDGKLARDSGLALQFVFGLFIACYTASSCLEREMRTGTASAVLSKPIGRATFFLSKFAGTAAVIICFSICSGIATLLSERVSMHFIMQKGMVGYITDWITGGLLLGAPFAAFIIAGILNYRRKRPFESTAFALMMLSLVLVLAAAGLYDRAGRFAPYDLHIHKGIIQVSIMVTFALIVISSIAITLSSRLSVVPTMVISGAVFVLGLMSDYLFGARALESSFFKLVYRIIPDWQNFWTVDALADGGMVPWSYVGHTAVYAGAYSAGVIFIGLLMFCGREMD